MQFNGLLEPEAIQDAWKESASPALASYVPAINAAYTCNEQAEYQYIFCNWK